MSWISDFVDGIPDAEACADILTRRGLEVSDILRPLSFHPHIVVGKILNVRAHPHADRLTLCQVDVGRGEPLTIVCGAPNARAGQSVPTALPGAILHNGLEIKKSKIRGTTSEGMLCSAAELGLSQDAEGLYVLPDGLHDEEPGSFEPGSPLEKAMGPQETTLELEISPNRPDALSIVGVARELAAALDKPLMAPSPKLPDFAENGKINVVLDDPQACPAYLGLAMKNATSRPSPVKVVKRLEACGVRSLGSIIDATNYVLLELGHPVHVFDRDLLKGGQIKVRRAQKGEKISCLTGDSYTLDPTDLVITDQTGAVALAGIAGGQQTGVTEKTQNLFLECARFEPSVIRRTGRRLGLSTESSYRFERGVPASGLPVAMARLVQFLHEWSGAESDGQAVQSGDTRPHSTKIIFSPRRSAQRLGLNPASPAAQKPAEALSRLGFRVQGSGDALSVTPPPHRIDIHEEADLWEELARTVGLDSIPETQPSARLARHPREPADALISKAKNILVGAGYSEIITGSLLSLEANGPTALGPTLVLSNPIGPETASLRGSLWPGILAAGAHNLSRGWLDLRLFEVGHVFAGTPEKTSEEIWVGGILCGERHPGAWGQAQRADIFDIKGLVESLALGLGLPLDWGDDTPAGCLEGRGWTLHAKGQLLGRAGEVPPPEGLFPPGAPAVYLFEFSLSRALPLCTRLFEATAPPRFPRVERDLSFVVGDEISAKSILRLVRDSAGETLEGLRVKDVYRGSQVPAGHRSLTLQLEFRAPDRTLRDKEIDERIKAITGNVKRDFNAEVRGAPTPM